MTAPSDEFSNNSTASNNNSNQTVSTNDNPIATQILTGNLNNDVQQIKKIFDRSFDVIYREFEIGNSKKAILIFLEELVDNKLINSDVLKPLLNFKRNGIQTENIQEYQIENFLQNHVITTSNIKLVMNIQEVVEGILSGNTILLIDGLQKAIFVNLRKFDKRNVEEPTVEPVVRGPREGFTEDLRTNISLIRRRLKTSKLKMEKMKVGRLSKTDIVITYLDGIVKSSLVEEVRQRISRIDIDAIVGSSYVEEITEDNPFSVFPQFGVTERPDKLTASLLEGHVGIIVDNTPMALVAPQVFVEMMRSSEDYYQRYITASLIICLRYLFLGLSSLLPAAYISLLTFHQGMIPRPLLLSIASSREGVPLPLFVESLLMQFFFEGLHEASVRLPRAAGQAVSIVGGLVIGQTAVQAGIVSAATVIIISVTGIASFIIPEFNLAASIRIIRFFMMILASTLGLYGVFIGLIVVFTHIAKLRSFGIPFFSPIAPLNLSGLKDTFMRAPWWAMISRPKFLETKDKERMKRRLRPHTPKSKN